MNRDQVSKIMSYCVAMMILTSVHHVYGAIIYNTPWRLHVLMISVPVIILIVILRRLFLRKDTVSGSFVFWILFVVVLISSVALIGIYEGVYNHILKNILFFGGIDNHTFSMLFPPPKYEIPNDLLFEVTGVLQGVIAIPLTIQVIALTLSSLKSTRIR